MGAETGPNLLLNFGRGKTEKPFPPLYLVVSTSMIWCDSAFCARTVCAFNNGALMLYNIAAPLSKPTPAPLLNARFTASEVPFTEKRDRLQTPILEAPTALQCCLQGQPKNHYQYIMKHIRSQGQNEKPKTDGGQLGPARWSPEIPFFVAYRVSIFVSHVVS